MTTGLENKQAVEDAVSHAHVGVCPMMVEPREGLEEAWFRIRFEHLVHLREHPEVECSCR